MEIPSYQQLPKRIIMTEKNEQDWPFEDPTNVAVFTTEQIMSGSAQICCVSHDEDDGAWQFYPNAEVTVEDVKLVALHRVFSLDNSLKDIADLPLGWRAERQGPNEPWQRSKKA